LPLWGGLWVSGFSFEKAAQQSPSNVAIFESTGNKPYKHWRIFEFLFGYF
jgi:hypothetical protein